MRTVAFEIAVVPSVCCEVLQAVTHRAGRAGCCSATSADAERSTRITVLKNGRIVQHYKPASCNGDLPVRTESFSLREKDSSWPCVALLLIFLMIKFMLAHAFTNAIPNQKEKLICSQMIPRQKSL